jgi:hypothetical protein
MMGMRLRVALARAQAEPFLRSGQLVRVLEDWSPSFEGLFLYYSSHRQVPAALRALIDMIGAAGSSNSSEPLGENPFQVAERSDAKLRHGPSPQIAAFSLSEIIMQRPSAGHAAAV